MVRVERELHMAKMKQKTKKAIAKRFFKTKTGKIKHASAGRGHLLSHKSRKRKRMLRGGKLVSHSDHHRITELLPR